MLDQSIAHGWSGDARPLRKQLSGCLEPEPIQLERRHVRGLEGADVALARREQQDDPLGFKAPSDEPERVGGGGIQPMRVVDEAQHGPLLGQFGEQRQASREREESLLARAVGHPQRCAESVGLGGW